ASWPKLAKMSALAIKRRWLCPRNCNLEERHCLPPDDHKTQNQETFRAAADRVASELWSIGKALEGTADRMVAEHGKAEFLLMERASELILAAACLGLIDSLVKIPGVIPGDCELLDEPRP